ncbi:MAG: hypothetical protein HGA80_02635 [Candidatus Omnitrophica bacterium]|nr:hypothetical protein [Candidatus Omnitrophota bacterium]
MDELRKEILKHNSELFELSQHVDGQARLLLKELNHRRLRLFDLAAHQRIFLFILMRSLKSYKSILLMCQEGFGQDVSTLLRSLLENLITARYILRELRSADELAKRFVTYKWVILRRDLEEDERELGLLDEAAKESFARRKAMILDKTEEFKKTFKIISDRALVTWSGRTVRDMAKAVDRKLLDEYGKTFRLCSRFSHPGILGDQEYMIQDGKSLVFSPLPSEIGVRSNLLNAVSYALSFVELTAGLFRLGHKEEIAVLGAELERQRHPKRSESPSHKIQKQDSGDASIRESIVLFRTGA